jgi:hypothetical protein
MIGFLISLIVISMVIGLFWWAVGALPFIPPPMAQIIRVVIVVAGCLWLIGALFGHGGFGSFGGWGHGIGIGAHIN